MAYAALSVLLESLETFSSPKSEKLQSLIKNLKFFQDFLQNSTDKCYDQKMTRSIEEKIREVVYKAKDVIEEFVYSNPCRSQDLLIDIFDEECSIHRVLQQILQEIGSMKVELDSMKAETIKLGETISTEHKSSMSVKSRVINDLDLDFSTDEEDTAVKFHKVTRIIVDRLLFFSSSSSSSSVLEFASFFVGDAERVMEWMFALNCLAKEVLDHPSVVSYFQIRVRVTVYDMYTDAKFFIGRNSFSHSYDSIQDLVKDLHKELASHRYLVVVTNYARSSQNFLHIHRWFPEYYNGSRVILYNIPLCKKSETSSLRDFAKAHTYLHDKMFERRSSRLDTRLYPSLREIAENCQGLRPLLEEADSLLSESESLKHYKKIEKRICYSFPSFFPEKTFYIFYDILQLSAAVDSHMIEVEKKQKNVVVGLDDDLLKIKDQLIWESGPLEIITVVGMGGIGKTTLAKAAFDDPLIQHHFYARAWIKVSPVYQLRNLLLELLHIICHLDDQTNRLTTEQLKEELRRKLKGQRFLIIMDDLWSTEAWGSMRRCFPDDNNGSRILLTTRLKILAEHVKSKYTHEMRLLDKEQSWELMHYQISASAKKVCPDELAEIGKKIAGKCRGLPLSILVIAGVLSNMSEIRDCWEKVAENLDSLLTSDPEKCLEILALSYNYLPHHLKACFLYMCAFPEDCEIDCQRLNRLWVAEGFVKAESGRNLEEVAGDYLEDLVKRSLVLVGKRSVNGEIKTCRLHDILRDFSLREAQKENFMLVITKNVQVHSEGNAISRRLSFHSGSCGNFQPDPTVQLNSFLYFDVGFDTIPDMGFVLSKFNFKLLRVLDINFLRFDYVPDLILDLIHLRFLALTAACELPSSISKLFNLQTLIVHGPWLSKKLGKTPTLPMEIWKMSQLRHLNLSAALLLAGPMLSEDDASSSLILKNLQSLNTVRPTSCTEQLFHNLPNLKKLGIRQIREDLDTQSGSSDFLENLIHLHQLETVKCSFYVRNIKKNHLPQGHVFPQRLKKLTLSGGYLPWTDMETLGMLPNLEVLKLKNYAFQGPIWEANEDGFQSLKVLLIDKTDLEHWNAYRYSFPRLDSLVLRFCESLKDIPNDIADEMQLIELHCCSSSAESSAREIKEEQRNRDNDGLVVRITSKVQMSSVKADDS